jgi:Helix-turn-helix domain
VSDVPTPKPKRASLLFWWQRAIASSSGPQSPTTRLVLLALSTHMRPDGSSAFPSIRRLAQGTALSDRSVGKHLKIAEQEGWIERCLRGTPGRGWRRYEYRPLFPKGAPGGSAPNQQAPAPDARRAERGDFDVRQEVPPNNSVNISKNNRLKAILASTHPPSNHIIDKIGCYLNCKAWPGEEYLAYWTRLRAKAQAARYQGQTRP